MYKKRIKSMHTKGVGHTDLSDKTAHNLRRALKNPALTARVNNFIADHRTGLIPPTLGTPAIFAAARGSPASPESTTAGAQGRLYSQRPLAIARQPTGANIPVFATAKSALRF